MHLLGVDAERKNFWLQKLFSKPFFLLPFHEAFRPQKNWFLFNLLAFLSLSHRLLRADTKRHIEKSRIQIKVSLYVRAPSEPCNYLSIRVDIEIEIANCKSLRAPSNEVKMLFPLTLERRALSAESFIERLRMQIRKYFRFRGDDQSRVDPRWRFDTQRPEIRSDRDNCRPVICV